MRGARWRKVIRPVASGAAVMGLMLAMQGAGVGVAGATSLRHHRDHRRGHHRHHHRGHHSREAFITDLPTYVGGHGKADPKLAPVYIGVANQETGAAAPGPTFTTGAALAVKYINQHTGGIDGHPLKMALCKIPTTVASATKCGEEFANNAKIDSVALGMIDVGNTALESALKSSKKPLFQGISISTADDTDPYNHILLATNTGIASPMATLAKKYLHAKSVSLTYPSNEPAEVLGADIVAAALKHLGVTVYKVGFTSSDTNLTEPLQAAHVANATMLIMFNSGGPECSDTYLTLKSLGLSTKKVLVNAPCDTPTVAKGDGGTLPTGWYYASVSQSQVKSPTTKTAHAVYKVAVEYGDKTVGVNPNTLNAFGLVLTMARFDTEILKAHKKISPATVMAKAKAFKGPVLIGSPHIDCGGYPRTGPAACNILEKFFQTKKGVLKDVTPWLKPPKGFKRPSSL